MPRLRPGERHAGNRREPAQVLRAIGYFKDGDLNTLSQLDQQLLRRARDGVDVLPDVVLKSRSSAVPLGENN
jgi:hypothetical protein